MKLLSCVFSIFLICSSTLSQTIICEDCDNDGLKDNLEQTLADKFAPIIYHDAHEKHMPTNVDAFLKKTNLYFTMMLVNLI